MELKVNIAMQMAMGIVIATEFTAIVDTEEEAVELGKQAQILSSGFMEGYGGDD